MSGAQGHDAVFLNTQSLKTNTPGETTGGIHFILKTASATHLRRCTKLEMA